MTALSLGENVVTITPADPVVRYTFAGFSPLRIYSTGGYDTYCSVYDSSLVHVANFDDSPNSTNFDFSIPTNIGYADYYFDISLYQQAAVNAVFSVFVEAVIPHYDYTDSISYFSIENLVQFDLNATETVAFNLHESTDYPYLDIVSFFTVGNEVITFLGTEKVDVIYLGLQVSNSYSHEVYIAPNWIQRNYTAKIGDLTLPIASFSATLSASGSSYVTLQIPALSSQLLDDILARKSQPIEVNRSHLYSDGSIKERVFIRVNYDSISADTGPKSGTSITLTGRKYLPVTQSKDVYETNAYYRNYNAGSVRYRLPVNDAINLGDRLFIDDSDFIVGKITYSVSTSNEFMECAEYVADGTDITGIGNNIRPTPLQEYLVVESNPNYFLWQAKGYLYNGRAYNPADTVNYSYSLWYDAAGLLWYAANFPVYQADGITQASINI